MNSQQIRFDEDLVRRYDRSGPRYTSYPTAVQFSEKFRIPDIIKAVGPERMKRWIPVKEAIDSGALVVPGSDDLGFARAPGHPIFGTPHRLDGLYQRKTRAVGRG